MSVRGMRSVPTIRRLQRGSVGCHPQAAAAQQGASVDIVVTVSGESISHSVSNGNTAKAGVRVDNDGTIDKREGDIFSQIDASTDWRIPNGSGAGFHVMFTKGGLDPTPIGVLDTWTEITSDQEIRYEESSDDSESSGTITVHISDDGGTTTLDTGVYPLDAIVGLPP